MPPASPLPGWSSGLVWTETVAMRRGRPRRTGVTVIHSSSALARSVNRRASSPIPPPARDRSRAYTPCGYAGAMHGYSENRDAHLKRLRRVEGQVRGLQRMVEEDQYCIDVLTQVSAATRALESFALAMLEEHLEHCVAAAIQDGGEEAQAKLTEANAAIARLVRS